MLFSETLCEELQSALVSAQNERRFSDRAIDSQRNAISRNEWLEKSFLEDNKVTAAMQNLMDLMVLETRINEPD
ncbi:MAG: hypothetical protein H7267_02620 [Sandarakinorhabdus sp.]|nr:hypothetical protein [Sandarakinorhabdus sp.]